MTTNAIDILPVPSCTPTLGERFCRSISRSHVPFSCCLTQCKIPSNMAFEIFLRPVIALPIILAVCYFVYAYVTAKSNLPDLPWVGVSDGQWFAKGRARIRNTFNFKAAVQCAYDDVSFTLFRVHQRLFLTRDSLSTRRRVSHALYQAPTAT